MSTIGVPGMPNMATKWAYRSCGFWYGLVVPAASLTCVRKEQQQRKGRLTPAELRAQADHF